VATVVVVGAGSIGGYVAWQLAEAGHDVALGVRTPFERLVVEAGGARHEVRAALLTDPAATPTAEWVFLATKAHQTAAAAPWLAAACAPGTTRGVVVLQNGVEHLERVAPLVPAVPIVPCIVSCAAEAVAPGHVVHHGFSTFEVPADNADAADTAGAADAAGTAAGLAELFGGTAAAIVAVDDFLTASWRKLIANAAISPVTALTLRRLDVLLDPGARDLAVALGRECVAVGRAVGAALGEDAAEVVIDGAAGNAAAGSRLGSSMLYDRLAGRPTEHDALSGAVVRAGRRVGIQTPLQDAVVALLAAAGPLPGAPPQTSTG
jgi:2-dehydropantoate 2-reductase